MSSRDMTLLYEKLGQIEKVDRAAAIATELTSGPRTLRKSVSVDHEPAPVHTHFTTTPAYGSVSGSLSAKDTSPSETLPDARGRQMGKSEVAAPRGHSLSPGTARRKFYDSFDQPPSSVTTASSSSIFSPRDRRGSDVQRKTGGEPVTSSAVTSRARRTLFGAKRAVSVDSSGVQSTIAQIGAKALFLGAPSSYNSAATPVSVQPSGKHKSGGDISSDSRTKTESISTKHTSSLSREQPTSSSAVPSSSTSGAKSDSSSTAQTKKSTGSGDKKSSSSKNADSSSKKEVPSSSRKLPPVLARLAGLKGFDGSVAVSFGHAPFCFHHINVNTF